MTERKELFLIVKGKYYWRTYFGMKPYEIRKKTPFNVRKIGGKHFTHLKLQLGYNSKNVIIIPITSIEETETFYKINLNVKCMQIVVEYKVPHLETVLTEQMKLL